MMITVQDLFNLSYHTNLSVKIIYLLKATNV